MEKLWLNSYEQGVNAEIDITRYKSITDVFNQSAQKFGGKPANTISAPMPIPLVTAVI